MDWNNDGILDIFSGCYRTGSFDTAKIFYLKGQAEGFYAQPVPLNFSFGDPIVNVPVTGIDGSEKQQRSQGFNYSFQPFFADIDADGDLDIINSTSRRKLFLIENRGVQGEPRFDEYGYEMNVGDELKAPIVPAPHLYDWDGDGDLDLICGSLRAGHIFLSTNIGKAGRAKWSDFEILLAMPKRISTPRVFIKDWNKDGLADLLVGYNETTIGSRNKRVLTGRISLFLQTQLDP